MQHAELTSSSSCGFALVSFSSKFQAVNTIIWSLGHMCTHAHTPTLCLPQTRDPKFDEMEQRVLSLEALLRTMVKDIQSWQDEMQVCVL